jgi:hypothetical protein
MSSIVVPTCHLNQNQPIVALIGCWGMRTARYEAVVPEHCGRWRDTGRGDIMIRVAFPLFGNRRLYIAAVKVQGIVA